MTQPDPDFVAFFAGDWQRLLEGVEIPGMTEPSWDRRAAYLLWVMGSHYDAETPWYWRDVMLSVILKEASTPKPLAEVLTVHREDITKFPYVEWNALHQAELGASIHSVGKATDWRSDIPEWSVNPIEDADCAPQPGGVSFAFDSSEWSGDNG